MNRRLFLRRTIGAIAFAPFLPWDAAKKFIARIGPRTRGSIKTAQTISDLLVSFEGEPADVNHLFTFFRSSRPDSPILRFAMNQRSTFRWVPTDLEEIALMPGDVFDWRIESFPPVANPRPVVMTQGHEIETGRLVIDQAYYGDEA